MISVQEIKSKSLRFYKEVLQNAVTDAPCFPRTIRSDKSLSRDFHAMSKEIASIMEGSKDRLGYGYKVLSSEIATKQHGKQNIPTDIIFESLDDYLHFINKTKEYILYKKLVSRILTDLPVLKEWIIINPIQVIDYAEEWDGLLKVCRWFIVNDCPDKYYIRQLPIQVHTKFIEKNKPVISSLLDYLIPHRIDQTEKVFEKRYRLRFSESSIRIRFLDDKCRIIPEVTDMALPIPEFCSLRITASKVLITENLMNFLTFPPVSDSIIIWGAGFAVENLKGINWLTDKRIIYWGDIDTHGMQILSQLRYYFPHSESLMMDLQTLDDHREFQVIGKGTNVNSLPNLTAEESGLFSYLKENNIRLEQEKITHEYTMQKVYAIQGQIAD